MKKLVLLFVASLSLLSCNKDDNTTQPTAEASIVGSWEFFKEGTLENGQEILDVYDHDCSNNKDYTEFASNGVVKDHYFNTSCTETIDSSTWTKNGSILTLFGETYTITELSATTLKVQFSETLNGVTTTYISVFTRK
jgi:hypothetical protein